PRGRTETTEGRSTDKHRFFGTESFAERVSSPFFAIDSDIPARPEGDHALRLFLCDLEVVLRREPAVGPTRAEAVVLVNELVAVIDKLIRGGNRNQRLPTILQHQRGFHGIRIGANENVRLDRFLSQGLLSCIESYLKEINSIAISRKLP